jgi:hypothetical protein
MRLPSSSSARKSQRQQESSLSSSSSRGGGVVLRCRARDFLLLGIPLLALQVIYFHNQLLHNNTSIAASSVTTALDHHHIGNWTPLLLTTEEAYTNLVSSTIQNNTTTTTTTSKPKPADGSFNGHPIYYQEAATTTTSSSSQPIYSNLHCVGETNEEPFFHKRISTHMDFTWRTRSCHFEFFCFDTVDKEFVIFLEHNPNNHTTTNDDNDNRDRNPYTKHHEVTQTIWQNVTAQGYKFGVSIGGINQKWTQQGIQRLNWFPQVRHEPPTAF